MKYVTLFAAVLFAILAITLAPSGRADAQTTTTTRNVTLGDGSSATETTTTEKLATGTIVTTVLKARNFQTTSVVASDPAGKPVRSIYKRSEVRRNVDGTGTTDVDSEKTYDILGKGFQEKETTVEIEGGAHGYTKTTVVSTRVDAANNIVEGSSTETVHKHHSNRLFDTVSRRKIIAGAWVDVDGNGDPLQRSHAAPQKNTKASRSKWSFVGGGPSQMLRTLPRTAGGQRQLAKQYVETINELQTKLDRLYDFENGHHLITECAKAQVEQPNSRCGNWASWLYVDWSHARPFFSNAADEALGFYYASGWRTLSASETSYLQSGMQRWYITEATLERALDELTKDYVAAILGLQYCQSKSTSVDAGTVLKCQDTVSRWERRVFPDVASVGGYLIFSGPAKWASEKPRKLQPLKPALYKIPVKPEHGNP